MALPEDVKQDPSPAKITPDGNSLLVECLHEDGTVVSVKKGANAYDALAALTNECQCGAPYHRMARTGET